MENLDSNENNFVTKSWKVYYLSAIFIGGSLMQWLLLVYLDFVQFLLNFWLLVAAYITFMLIVLLYIAMDFAEKTLPDVLRWIFAILVVEILSITLGKLIVYANHLVLHCSLAVILICLVMLLEIGRRIKLDHLPVMVLVVFSSNMLFIILPSILLIVTKFATNFYSLAFLTLSPICYLILMINTLYVSMLIQYTRNVIHSLTSCLKLAAFIHVLFVAFVWFTLALAAEISEILSPKF